MSPACAARSEFEIKRYFGDYPVHISGWLWMMVEKYGTIPQSRTKCYARYYTKLMDAPVRRQQPSRGFSRYSAWFGV